MNGVAICRSCLILWSITIHFMIIDVQHFGNESRKFLHPWRLAPKANESNVPEHLFQVVLLGIQGQVIQVVYAQQVKLLVVLWDN